MPTVVKSRSQGQLAGLLDPAAEWPHTQAAALTELALRCVKMEPEERPKLAEVVRQLQALRGAADRSQALPKGKSAKGVPGQRDAVPDNGGAWSGSEEGRQRDSGATAAAAAVKDGENSSKQRRRRQGTGSAADPGGSSQSGPER